MTPEVLDSSLIDVLRGRQAVIMGWDDRFFLRENGQTYYLGKSPTPEEWVASWREELRRANPTVGIRIQ